MIADMDNLLEYYGLYRGHSVTIIESKRYLNSPSRYILSIDVGPAMPFTSYGAALDVATSMIDRIEGWR